MELVQTLHVSIVPCPQLAPVITSAECSGVLELVSGSPGLKLRTSILRSAFFKLDPMKRTEYPVLEWRHGCWEDTVIHFKRLPWPRYPVEYLLYVWNFIKGSTREFRPKLTFHPSLILWSNKGDSRIRPTVPTINTSHLLFSNPSPSWIVHSRSSHAPHVQAPLPLSKALPSTPQICLLHPHSNTVSHIHSSGTTPTSLRPFSWETECLSLLCSKLTIFLMGIGHQGFFCLLSFPYSSDSMSQKPKTRIWQLTDASCQDRMDEATKLLNRPEKKKKDKEHSIHFIYISPPPFSYQEKLKWQMPPLDGLP